MNELIFAEPAWLFAIVPAALLLVGLLVYHGIQRKSRLSQFASSSFIEKTKQQMSVWGMWIRWGFILIGLILLMTTMARPQKGFKYSELKFQSADILIALDVSKSMLATDMKPNRLKRSIFAIKQLVDELEGERIGLVAFSGEAFLQCPLTLDYGAFLQALDTMQTGIIPVGGTNLARAIQEGELAFDEGNEHKYIILITDGEDHEQEGMKQAAEAAENDVTVFTIGVGTEGGSTIPIEQGNGVVRYQKDETGNVVMTKLVPDTLKQIAAVTNGYYTPLGATGEGLLNVYRTTQFEVNEGRQDIRKKIPNEKFQWPLGFAILLLLLEPLVRTRKRIAKAMPLLLAGLLSFSALPEAQASTSEKTPVEELTKKAHFLYSSMNYKSARAHWAEALSKTDNIDLRYNLGVAEYRLGEYEKAAQTFADIIREGSTDLQTKAFYNQGNCYYEIGKDKLSAEPKETIELWEKAILSYENTLELDPGHEDAAYNKKIIEELLEQLKEQEGMSNEDQQNSDNQEQQENQEQSDSQQSQNGQDQQSQQQQGQEQDGQQQESQNQQGQQQDNQQQSGSQQGEQQEGQQGQEQQSNQNGEEQQGQSGEQSDSQQQQGQQSQMGEGQEENSDQSQQSMGQGEEQERQEGQDMQNTQNGQQETGNQNQQGAGQETPEEGKNMNPQEAQGEQDQHNSDAEEKRQIIDADSTTGEPRPAGQISEAANDINYRKRAEAARMLDMNKSIEQMLPIYKLGPGNAKPKNAPKKDW